MVVGLNVRRFRLRQGLSQENLAARVELVGQGYVSELEAGKKNPTAVTLFLLARALGVDVGELFDVEGLPPQWVVGKVNLPRNRRGKIQL